MPAVSIIAGVGLLAFLAFQLALRVKNDRRDRPGARWASRGDLRALEVKRALPGR